MSRKLDNRDQLLGAIREISRQGQAENEAEDESLFLRNFLPIRGHFRVLDPDIRLVIGDRGAGKTHLFRALSIERGRQKLNELADKSGHRIARLDVSAWRTGFETGGKFFPPPTVFGEFASQRTPQDMQLLWLSLLVRMLLRESDLPPTALPSNLRETVRSGTWELGEMFRIVKDAQASLYAVLDSLDEQLSQSGRFLFVTYDELDRVSPGNWESLRCILQGLTQFWAAYSRRWRHIRCKIFLRRDLYERAALFGPDISKIAAHRTELDWNVTDLYGMLVKRLLNGGGDFASYLKPVRIPTAEDSVLGIVPEGHEPEDYRPAIERIFGEFMGSDPRKGMTFRWIVNHLQDGHGRVFPRPLLRLVEDSSEIERRDHKAEGTKLIHHTALRGALDRVSEFRVQELAQDEFPWIRVIQETFQQDSILVPVEKREILGKLRISWESRIDRPPETDPEALLNYLADLGVVFFRGDGRVDVGDLYLRGLHLKRKGGVQRPGRLST